MDFSKLPEFQLFFFKIAFPLIFYTFHGWFATAMAIWALFHPYNPIFLRVPFTDIAWQLPCTPGIFPKRQAKLAQAVASIITDTLLTTSDIKAQAENLVTEQNIYLTVDGFIEAVLKEFRDTTKLHRLAHDLSELSPLFIQEFVVATVDGIEKGKDKRIATITEKIFDQIVMGVRISKHQADEIAARIMEAVVTPANIRVELIKILNDENIMALDESIQSHASTPFKLLAKVIGVKRVCYEWRNFLVKEPQAAEKVITDLLARFSIQDQIANRISHFDLRSMPLQTIAKLRQQTIELVEEFLIAHKEDILNSAKQVQGDAMAMVHSAIIRFNPAGLRGEWVDRAKKDMSAFCYSYLKAELGNLLERAIPALGVYGMIARKIDLFSPQQLEAVVKRVCRQELKWLEFLGAVIGLWLGGVQVLINFLPYH